MPERQPLGGGFGQARIGSTSYDMPYVMTLQEDGSIPEGQPLGGAVGTLQCADRAAGHAGEGGSDMSPCILCFYVTVFFVASLMFLLDNRRGTGAKRHSLARDREDEGGLGGMGAPVFGHLHRERRARVVVCYMLGEGCQMMPHHHKTKPALVAASCQHAGQPNSGPWRCRHGMSDGI